MIHSNNFLPSFLTTRLVAYQRNTNATNETPTLPTKYKRNQRNTNATNVIPT